MRSRARRALACALALAAAGCSGRTTAPPEPFPTGDVSIVVEAPGGGPAAGASVELESVLPVGGVRTFRSGTTDLAGTIAFADVPAAGHIVAAVLAANVAAESLQVAASAVTSVTLALVAESRVHGRATLFARADHRGTEVTMDGAAGASAVTDSTGAFTLAGAAPGRWTLALYQPGFTIQTRVVDVPGPDSDVNVPDVELPVDPAGP